MIQAVMIDNREPKWVQNLNFENSPKSIVTLDAGDFWVATESGMLVIERKTPNDFLGSLADDRLFVQAAKLAEYRQSGYFPYILITGNWQIKNGKIWLDKETNWSFSSIEGAILTLQEMGIFIHYCNGDTDLEAAIIRLAKRERKPELLIAPPRHGKILGLSAAFIAGLPGIGTERALQVMNLCGSAAWALVALTDADTQIPGVGDGIKNNIRHVLGLKESDQQFAIQVDDNWNEKLTIQPIGSQ